MKKISILATGLFLIAMVALPGRSFAQVDPHFSQYYSYPLWLNPGLTGVMDGDYRLSANYKRQWASISSPFSTTGVSFDTYPFKNLGVGGTILNQSAGDGGYNYVNALLSAAYRLQLDAKGVNFLSVGLQAGVLNRRINPNKLQFGSQYSPILGFDPNVPSGENFSKTSATEFDANFGIMYFNGDPTKRLNPFVGASVYHLSHPDDPFMAGTNEKLPLRYNFHGGVCIKASDVLNLTPNALYIRQGNAHEVAAGLYGQYMLQGYTDLLFGATYRFNDAIIPSVGFHLGDFTFGVSYDINVSTLNIASESRGGVEFSLSYIRHKKIQDPKFICPRL